jgi:hypothetical protein
MRRFFSPLFEFVEHTGSLIATLVTAAVVILIIVIGWFWFPIYTFLDSSHLFQALVLLMFIEVIILSIKRRDKSEQPIIFIDEIDAMDRLYKLVDEKRVRKVRILSGGLQSRFAMIEHFIKEGVRIQCIVQDPNTAIDKRDSTHTIATVQQLLDLAHLEKADCLFRLNANVATVRAALLYEPNNRARHLFVGWYTYSNRNTQLYGSHNPTLYYSSDSISGRRLCDWVEKIMDSAESEARDVPEKNTSSTT